MERKTRLSICVVGVAQWPQLASSNRLGHCERVASQQIYMSLMNKGRQPRAVFGIHRMLLEQPIVAP